MIRKTSRECDNREKHEHRIDRMAIAERSVRYVIDDRKEQGKNCGGENERVSGTRQKKYSQQGADRKKEIAGDDGANESGISAAEIGDGMFGAEPGGDNSSTGEPHKKRRLATNEGSGDAPFFSEICAFADLRVMARFLEAGDALEAAEGVFIKNIVVADPELEGKAGANWNEAVADCVVA